MGSMGGMGGMGGCDHQSCRAAAPGDAATHAATESRSIAGVILSVMAAVAEAAAVLLMEGMDGMNSDPFLL